MHPTHVNSRNMDVNAVNVVCVAVHQFAAEDVQVKRKGVVDVSDGNTQVIGCFLQDGPSSQCSVLHPIIIHFTYSGEWHL